MRIRNLILFLLIAGLIVAGSWIVSPALRAADKSTLDSEEITNLLSEAKAEAVQLKNDAETMETFARSKLSWESHAVAVERIKDHVNAVGRVVNKLNGLKTSASPWQETAIDRITPLLNELATNTNSTIACLNESRGRLHNEEYKELVAANSEMSGQLSAMIGDFVDYGKTKARFERLRNRLEIDRT